MTKRYRRNLKTIDGILRDSKLWTVEDWKTLHEHLDAAIREIAERHKERENYEPVANVY